MKWTLQHAAPYGVSAAPYGMSAALHSKEVFSEKSCFKNFAHPLSEEENIKKYILPQKFQIFTFFT